jgi:hypothetical protein
VAAGREARRHRQRRVAAVGAQLQHAPGAARVDEHLEEAALDGAGQHLRRLQRLARLLRERRQQRLGLARVILGVALDRLGDDVHGAGL